DRRSGQSEPHLVDPLTVKPANIDLHRFGIAEQERRVRQQQKPRQQDGAERIDVLERIETDAAEFPGGIVAEAVSHETMRRLMKRDRDDQRKYPDREVVKRDVERQSTVLRCN